MKTNNNDDVLIRIVVDTKTKPIEWEVWTRGAPNLPWAYINGGTAASLDVARRLALRFAEDWSYKISRSSTKTDIIGGP
jgi:hypothetical protein